MKSLTASSGQLSDHIKTFNLYIVDMCDMLWRSRAFGALDKHPQSVFHLLGPQPPSVKHCYSLSQHPAMIGLAVKFLAEVKPSSPPLFGHDCTILIRTKSQHHRTQYNIKCHVPSSRGHPLTTYAVLFLNFTRSLASLWQHFDWQLFSHFFLQLKVFFSI